MTASQMRESTCWKRVRMSASKTWAPRRKRCVAPAELARAIEILERGVATIHCKQRLAAVVVVLAFGAGLHQQQRRRKILHRPLVLMQRLVHEAP